MIPATWSFLRVIRLFFGSILVLTGIIEADWPAGIIGGFLLVQALLNTGCGPADCGLPSRKE